MPRVSLLDLNEFIKPPGIVESSDAVVRNSEVQTLAGVELTSLIFSTLECNTF